MALTDWTGFVAREKAVLLFLREGSDVLLILKKRGLGTGKINGPGGRVEAGESWEDAARRETEEETGLRPETLRPAASLAFQFTDGYSLDVRVFTAAGWTGTLRACDEADPFWQPADRLPWARMWADDALWLPPVLEGRGVEARFLFDNERMCEAALSVSARPPQVFLG